MKNAKTTIFAVLLTVGSIVPGPMVFQAQAGAYGERDRQRQCVHLRQSGKLRWYAIASGIVDDGSGRNGYGDFHTKSCHTTQQSCHRWISNIEREILNVDSVRTAYCKRVN